MDVIVKKSLWNHAGTAGLLMGLVSTASMFAGQYLSTLSLSGFLTVLIGLILWALETGGCIWLMWIFMKRFAAACPSADNSATFRMGMATAFLSALVYSAASFANLAFISVDFYTEQYQTLLQRMRLNKLHMVFLTDENRTKVGILTMEDLLEELVGDIQDESDTGEGLRLE